MNRTLRQTLCTLLILGRVSNLPSVWSDCLAGWWLSGGGTFGKLPVLLFGMSALYTGGMYLNDAFDADFDRQRRASRPIPSGAASPKTVWRLGGAGLALGTLVLLFLGKIAGMLVLGLVVCILLYNYFHKAFTASPWLMGLCRYLVYAIAGTTGETGLNGWPLWCGMALAFYVVGLSYVAKRESFRGAVPYWPLLLLAAPIVLAMLMNTGETRKPATLISLILALWIVRCVRSVFQGGETNVGRIVSGLLAGIIFVDWLAVAPQISHTTSGIVFLALFGLTKLLQKFVPAT